MTNTRLFVVIILLSLLNLGIDLVRLHEDRLCFSRQDLVAVAAGVAKKMSEKAEP